LGNLLLVTKAQNDKAANFEFARKQSVYFQADVPVPALNEPLRGLTEWRPADVLAREALLNAHLDAIWAFGLTAERAQGQPAADARRPQALSVK
ncbi:HNH endonuclease, partial [Herbaspirillum sp. HC18]